jgi:hypothetical protein
MMKRVDSGLPVVQMRWWYPLGVTFGVSSRGPALLDEPVVDPAGQGEIVDVGAMGGGPSLDVVAFQTIGRASNRVALAGSRAANRQSLAA